MRRILFFIVLLAALFNVVEFWKNFENQAFVIPEKIESVKAVEYFQEPQNGNTVKGEKQISFENVSFTYDSDLFTDVKGAIIPALPLSSPTDKPDGVYPQHINFVFANPYTGEQVSGDEYYSKVVIHVYQIEKDDQAANPDNLYVKFTNNSFKELKRVLANRSRISASSNKQLPYIPFADAYQAFYARAKTVSFQNGKGLLFLTQWQQDETVVNNQRLKYVFQGLTDDGKHFVYMNFAVAAKGLSENEDNFPNKYKKLDDSYKIYGTAEYRRHRNLYERYTLETALMLDKMPSEKYTPDLRRIESLIGSLKVK